MPSLPNATARSVIPCAPELVYKELTGYDTWQEWLPSIVSSRLLTREGTLAIVEVGLATAGSETVLIECIETPCKTVLARVIEGQAPVVEIDWSFEADTSGFTRVSVKVKRRLGVPLLRPASWLVLSPARCLAALGSRVAASDPGPEVITDGENLFELWETETGLVCWIKGRKYKLTPAEDSRG